MGPLTPEEPHLNLRSIFPAAVVNNKVMTRKASLRTITRNLCGLLCFSLSSKAFVGSSQRRHTMQRSLAEEGAKFPSRKNIVVGANDDGTSARKRSERPKRRAAGMPTRPTPPFEGAAVEEENEEEVTVEQYQDIAVVTDYTPAPDPPPISASQCDAVANFLNESEQQDDLLSFTSTWGRPLADEMRSANGWSQGSFQLTKATVRAVSSLGLVVDCHVKIKPLFFGAPKVEVQEGVEVQFIDALYENDADGAVPKNQRQPPSPSQFASYFGLTRNDGTMTAEEVKRAIVSMARRIGNLESSAKILRRCPTDADGTTMVTIQDNLFTNNVPNSLDTRYVFYDAVVEAVEKALRDPASPKRMRVDLATPELDPSMDSFRIGTLLEVSLKYQILPAYLTVCPYFLYLTASWRKSPTLHVHIDVAGDCHTTSLQWTASTNLCASSDGSWGPRRVAAFPERSPSNPRNDGLAVANWASLRRYRSKLHPVRSYWS